MKYPEIANRFRTLLVVKGIKQQDLSDKTGIGKASISQYVNGSHCPSDDDALETKALQTRLELKEEMIKEYQARLEAKEKKHKDREQFYMNLIEHLQAEISFKNEQIKHHNEAMDRKDATLKELYNILLERE